MLHPPYGLRFVAVLLRRTSHHQYAQTIGDIERFARGIKRVEGGSRHGGG